MPAIWGAVGAAVSTGFGLWGASKQQSDSEKAADRANRQAVRDWKYDEKIRRLTNKFNQQQFAAEKENAQENRRFQNQVNLQDWRYAKDRRKYEMQIAKKAYAQSEANYKLQLGFNNIAAAQAYEAERNRLQEIQIGQAFQQQDMMVQNIMESGEAKARGQSGRSAAKTDQSIMASYGRNIAILSKSMESAERQYNINLDKIRVEKYGADVAAESARMLKPERLPSIPKPLPLPVPKMVKPMKLPKRKKPVGVSAGSSAGAYLSTIGTGLSSGISAVVGANNKYG